MRDPGRRSQIKVTDDRRVIARAGLPLNCATAHTLEKAFTREQVVEAPANVALAHVAPGRPPREHLIVLRFERPSDVHQAIADDSFELRAFLGYGLVDVGRHVDPDNDRLFTWWAPWRNMRQRNIGWRLDYVAASKALVDETVHCVAYREVGTSDHAPVIAHLRDAPRPTDPG